MEYGLRGWEGLLAILAGEDLVLILVLMEYGLRAILKMAVLEERLEVLILVLMEYGLRVVVWK